MATATTHTQTQKDAPWMPRVVVFDFDGTLVDSLGVWDAIGLDWIARHGLAPWPTMQEEMAVATLPDAARLAHEHYNLGSVRATPTAPVPHFPLLFLCVHFFSSLFGDRRRVQRTSRPSGARRWRRGSRTPRACR